MNKDSLILDLKEILETEPESIGEYGTKYYLFSADEIKGIIELLEKIEE